MATQNDELIPGKSLDCRFCYPPEEWRIIHSTEHFRVQMGLGPMTEGYALVISEEHYSCCAAIPVEWLSEFEEVTLLVKTAQRRLYDASLLFEHGRSGACFPPGHGEDHCYHAHLHVMPTDASLADAVAEDYDLESLAGWCDVLETYSSTFEPYILIEDKTGLRYVAAPQRLPKRYLRTKLAGMLGEPWLGDWAAFPSYQLVEQGRERMSDEFRIILNNENRGAY